MGVIGSPAPEVFPFENR